MRILITALFAVFCLFGCSNMEPESGNNESESNRLTAEAEARLSATEGGRMVLRAIEAHGGLDAWHNAETSAYIWGFVGGTRTRLVAHNRTRQVYHDILALAGEAVQDGAQMAWDGSDAWIYPDSLMGMANPRFMTTTGYYFQSIPFVLADPGLHYEALAPALLDSIEHQMVRVTFEDGIGDAYGDHYTLYIHPETYMVSALRYRSTFGRGRPTIDENMRETLLYYKDYVTVDGLTTPTRFEGYGFSEGAKGNQYYSAESSEHSFSAPFDTTRLVMPDGGRVQSMPPAAGEQ
ncbi:MAG: hypothetical protein OXD43_04625 [Bacteroidetes bacterium]|nr:hypothetical protein [Bacteroidota bacterium]